MAHARVRTIVLLAGTVLATSACGAAVAREPTPAATRIPRSRAWVEGVGGTVTIGIDQAPTGCNPNAAGGNTWADQFVLEAVLPSAFVVSPTGTPIYDSAVITQAEVVNTSPETVVYTINPKAVWADGKPVTAADFVYAWREQRGSATTSAPSPTTATTPPPVTDVDDMATTLGYRDITSVKGSHDGRTVTVVFKTPYADWKGLFADLLPAHVLERVGWNPPCTTVDPSLDLSAGPYAIGSVTGPDRITLRRNPRWWGTRANIATIVVRVAKDPAQLAQWLSNGTVQIAEPTGYDESFLEHVGSSPQLSDVEDSSTTFVQLEFSMTGPVTSDERVRMAIADAVDRQALVTQVVGWADKAIVPAASHLYAQSQGPYPGPPAPPSGTSHHGTTTTSTFPSQPTPARPFPLVADPAQETKLLTAVGDTQTAAGQWIDPEGNPVVLRIASDEADPWAAAAARVLDGQLVSAGFAVDPIDEPTLTAAGELLNDGGADAAVLPFASSPFPTQALAWFTPLLGPAGSFGSEDWGDLDDPQVNQLLQTAAQQLTMSAAQPLYAQADSLLWKDMVALPLFSEPTDLAWSDSVGGIGPNPTGPGLLWFPETWGVLVPPTSSDTATT